MSDLICEFTVQFAPMPRARRAAYRNAIDILAEYLLELESEEAAGQDLQPVLSEAALEDEYAVALQSVYQQPVGAG
jgi:hypothetical protein